MSASDSHCTNEEQGGCEDDGEVTILFTGNTFLKCSERVWEEVSSTLKGTLNECRLGGSMRLSAKYLKEWKLILGCLESGDAPSSVYNRIKEQCACTLLKVAIVCQRLGVTSIPEAIDERIANEIATTDPLSARSRSQVFAYDFLYFNLECGFVKFVKQRKMVKSEKALAAFLVEIIKENEKIRKERLEAKKKPHLRGFNSAVGRILRFVNEMHDADRHRFCFLFAKRLMIERLDAFSEEFSDILDETRYN